MRVLAMPTEKLIAVLKQFLQVYSNTGALGVFGDSLIRSIGDRHPDHTHPKALDEWRDIWLEAGSKYPEMELPLRIFRVGIEYLKTKDERVMLDLITTERRILRQAVGLEEMTDDEAKD